MGSSPGTDPRCSSLGHYAVNGTGLSRCGGRTLLFTGMHEQRPDHGVRLSERGHSHGCLVSGRKGNSEIHPPANAGIHSCRGTPTFETSAYNQNITDNKLGFRLDTNTHFGALFGYYFFDQFSLTTPYAQGINVPGFDSGVLGRAQMINLGLTTTINNSTINDVRLVYLRDRYFGGVPGGGTGVPLTSLGFVAPAGQVPALTEALLPSIPRWKECHLFSSITTNLGFRKMPCVNSTTRSRFSIISQKL